MELLVILKRLMILEDADYILHLGDVLYHGPRNDLPDGYDPKSLAELIKNDDRFIFIKGNCDSEVDEMVTAKKIEDKYLLLEFDNFKFLLSHGHRKNINSEISGAESKGYDGFFYGHTHVKRLEKDKILVLNPGSTSIPKDCCKSFALYEDGTFYLYNLEDLSIIKLVKMAGEDE